MAYFEAFYDTEVNGVVTNTETIFVDYPDATSCSQEEALIAALSETAIRAIRTAATTLAPIAPTGKVAQERNCSGEVVDPGNGFDVIVTTDNDGAPGGGGSTGGTTTSEPAGTLELAGETNVKFYQPA